MIYSFHVLYCWFHFPYNFYMWLKNKYQNTSRDTMKIVEHTIDIILQHYDRPAHHSHKTIAAYGDENGYSSSCWNVCYWQTALWSILWVYIF